MPYKMNSEQFKSVLALSGSDRASHFIGKVADWEQLWGVKNDKGWLVPKTLEGIEYFPVWPHPEYAQKITDTHFPGYMATEIGLEEFLSKGLLTLEKDGIKVAVFPNKEWLLWVMKPSHLLECLQEEAAQYE